MLRWTLFWLHLVLAQVAGFRPGSRRMAPGQRGPTETEKTGSPHAASGGVLLEFENGSPRSQECLSATGICRGNDCLKGGFNQLDIFITGLMTCIDVSEKDSVPYASDISLEKTSSGSSQQWNAYRSGPGSFGVLSQFL